MENSVLKFTHEEGHIKLAFLDVQIEIENNELKTSVYIKATNTGELLNFKSECPDKYKKGVITNMLHRGFKISSNMQLFQQEIRRLKQIFSNNNYLMKLVDQCIESFLQSKSRQNSSDEKAKIVVYYQNQMNCNYKKDEKVLKGIIKHNVKPINNQEELDVIVYYKTLKTRDLIMKNNSCASQDKLSKSWAVYKFKCPNEDCELLNPLYIGQTRNTIKRRLEQHQKDGAIKEHMEKKHNTSIQTQDLENNTLPVKSFQDLKRMTIYEALLIMEQRPDINRQKDNFINPLKLYSRSPHATNTPAQTPHQAPVQHRYNLRSGS